MGVQDIEGKLQKITRWAIFKSRKKGFREYKISLKIIVYNLVCYVNVINEVLAREFGEISIKTKAYLASFGSFFRMICSVGLALAPSYLLTELSTDTSREATSSSLHIEIHFPAFLTIDDTLIRVCYLIIQRFATPKHIRN